ncbi:27364_t:CDS:1, partial [Racocetra persica]
INDQFGISSVSKTYGIKNMYKDFNYKDDVMRVENKLSVLEMQASDIIHNIVNTSQKESQ